MPKILVVDDEKNILELVRFNLEREGFQVLIALDGTEGLELARDEKPDLIVLDVMLPGMNGLEVCQELRREAVTKHIPIIMLSARAEEVDRILGLEMGADDYVTKPFSPRELVARIKASLRRARAGEEREDGSIWEERLDFGRLVIDGARYSVYVDGEKQDLTPKEFELLRFMAHYPGKVFTREQLLEKVWGYEYAGDSRTVDVHIRHIRQKLCLAEGEQPIETVRGVGYRFKEDWRCSS